MTRINSKLALPVAVATVTLMLAAGCGGGALNQNEGNGATDGEGGADDVYRWRLVTQQIPGTARYDETIVPFVEGVEEASDGRLIIEPFGADVLFPTNETLSSLQRGVIEVAAIFSGYWTGTDPVFGLAPGAVPGDPIMTYEEHQQRSEALQPIVDEAYEEANVISLGPFDYGPPEILMSQVMIEEMSDFRGLNIRTSGISSLFYSHLGASPIALSAPEIYQALQLGTIEAAEFNDFIVNAEMGLHEVTNYVIEPVLHQGVINDKELIVNPDAWEALPEDLQQIVTDVRDDVREASITAYTDLEEEAKQEWLDAGVEIVELPDEVVDEVRAAAAEFLNEYKNESDLTRRYIEGYAEVLHELGYTEEAERLGFTG